MKTAHLMINGLPVDAEFSEEDIGRIYVPLMHTLAYMHRREGRRIVCFVAGPPASGKSTLCAYLQTLVPRAQAVSMDGFHYPQAYLNSHTVLRNGAEVSLRDIKGAPESYDVRALQNLLAHIDEDISFPIYDRRIHEPVADAARVTGDIILLEGNWLLLGDAPWRDLRCDYSVFLSMNDPVQLDRILRRKLAGGYAEAEARRMVYENDRANIEYCVRNSRRGDLNLRRGKDGSWEAF